jgi:hypothetical protein
MQKVGRAISIALAAAIASVTLLAGLTGPGSANADIQRCHEIQSPAGSSRDGNCATLCDASDVTLIASGVIVHVSICERLS